ESGRPRLSGEGPGLLRRQVGDDHAVTAGVDGAPRERLEPEGEHGVVVGQEHQRDRDLAAEVATELEHPGERDARGECPLGCPLDDRSVGERVGERHAELDHVRALARRLPDEPARVPERRIARREVRDQGPLPPGAEPVERLPEPRHRPSAPLTTWTSLSPRPERPTTIVCRRGKPLASRIAWATACADSRAGMMPSSRARAWNAARASSPVIETNSKRPASLVSASSAPTP